MYLDSLYDTYFSIDKNELKAEENTKTNKNDEKIGIISIIGIIIYITWLISGWVI